MIYLFERKGQQTSVACSMSEIAGLTREMEAKGFRRIFTVPQTNHQLDMNDAYDEMVADDRIEAACTKKAGDEAWRDVAEIAQSY